jgi:Flp pilus assembly pilin Flp
MIQKFAGMIKDESGATAIEYGLIAAAVGLALAAIMPSLSKGIFWSLGYVYLGILDAQKGR